jgi:hypothetical protein
MNDGGRWHFSENGTPFEFENLGAYQVNPKRNRFTKVMIREYLRHFDINFSLSPSAGEGWGEGGFDDDFLVVNSNKPAVLLQQHPTASPAEYTLEEVKAGLPWR